MDFFVSKNRFAYAHIGYATQFCEPLPILILDADSALTEDSSSPSLIIDDLGVVGAHYNQQGALLIRLDSLV